MERKTPVAYERIILGVDPGTQVMGYGLIGINGKQTTVLQYGVIHLEKYKDHALKLGKIFERIVQLIADYLPDEMAIEAPFFGKNVQAMLKLGRAQGVAMAAALSRQVPIVEYSPKKIKQSVTGNGNAAKEQVAAMMSRLLGVDENPEFFDATDALAVALCHYYQQGIVQTKGGTTWENFLKENPNRIKKI